MSRKGRIALYGLLAVSVLAWINVNELAVRAQTSQAELTQMALALARVQAVVAAEHAQLAIKAKGDANGMKLHAKHVFCNLTVQGCAIGAGFPTRRAVELAGAATAVPIVDRAAAAAKGAMSAPDESLTASLVEELGRLTTELIAALSLVK